MSLTDPQRVYRREVARRAIEGYERWVKASDGQPLNSEIVGQLVMVARWYLQEDGKDETP